MSNNLYSGGDILKIYTKLEKKIDSLYCFVKDCCSKIPLNIGTGKGLYKRLTNNKWEFKSLLPGSNITLTETNNEIVISATTTPFSCQSLSSCSTDNLPEGTNNKYFTDQRAVTALTGQKISLFDNDSGYITYIPLTEYQLAFGDSSNRQTSSPDLTWDGQSMSINSTHGYPSGWGNVQHKVNSSGSEAGLSLINQGTGGLSFNIISTSNASGIGGGKFSLGDATNSQEVFQYNSLDNTYKFPLLASSSTQMVVANTLGVLGLQTIPSNFVQSVSSGTDITVNNTDPQNPIINFTGTIPPSYIQSVSNTSTVLLDVTANTLKADFASLNISQFTNNSGYLTSTGITPAALTKTDDTNVTLTLTGTPSTALLQGVNLALGWTGTLVDSRIASATIWSNKVTSLGAGTGISIGGTVTVPIVTNTAPDQTVVLSGGTGINISGTYPNFTITNSSPSTGGTVTSVAMTTPTGLSVTGSPITSSGTLGLSLTSGYIIPTTTEQANWNTAYTNRITSLTTVGTSGSSTLSSNTLNIPTYTLSGLGGQPLATNLTSLSGLSYSSASFVKMSAAGTFTLDTNTYLTSVGSGIANELTYWATSNTLGSLSTSTYPSLTELSYLKGTTSSIQTQLDSKGSGTVTSVSSLTLGTVGTDLTSSVVNSSTTPVITLNIPSSSATNRGVLSSTDWNTFNTKVSSVSGTGLITSSGGTTPIISTSMNTSKLVGRISGGIGVMEEITLGTNLSFTGSVLNATTGGSTTITATDVFNFGSEQDQVVKTISSALITNTNLKSFSILPKETSETSLDDFKLNGVSFNIENIIDNVSFDIRGTAINNATGTYTITYNIIY